MAAAAVLRRVGGTVKMDLVISHVYKDFGRGPVLRDVSLTVRQQILPPQPRGQFG